MAIASTDLVFYCSANMPEDDTSTNGGAIDPDMRAFFTDIEANDDLEVLSSSASDTTQTATLYGRSAGGDYVSQTVTLNGTTAVIFSTIGESGVIERVEKFVLSADCVGDVTLRRSVAGTTVATIPIGERGFRRLFSQAFAAIGSTKDYYEKLHVKNNHATLSLTSAAVVESADASGLVTFCLASAKGDTNTVSNRLTAPDGSILLDPDSFVDTSQSVPTGALAAGESIGIWVKLSLADGNAPVKSTWTPQISGQTT